MTIDLSFDVPEWAVDNDTVLVCIGLAMFWYTMVAIVIRNEPLEHAQALDRVLLWAFSPLCVVALPCYLVWAFGQYVLTRPEDRNRTEQKEDQR